MRMASIIGGSHACGTHNRVLPIKRESPPGCDRRARVLHYAAPRCASCTLATAPVFHEPRSSFLVSSWRQLYHLRLDNARKVCKKGASKLLERPCDLRAGIFCGATLRPMPQGVLQHVTIDETAKRSLRAGYQKLGLRRPKDGWHLTSHSIRRDRSP